jgi:site-specific recombinase XerD
MLTSYFRVTYPVTRLRGALAGRFVDGFAQHLEEAGFKPATIREYLRVVHHLSAWTEGRGDSLENLDDGCMVAFGRHLRHCCRCLTGKKVRKNGHAVARARVFLTYLRHLGIVESAEIEPRKAAERPLLDAFRRFMVEHRGLAESTTKMYLRIIANFLDMTDGDISRVNAGEIRAFVLDYNHRQLKNVAAALRAFLRYLIAEGRCPTALEGAIPKVASWRLATLPRYLLASDVERIIAACDPSTTTGCRDRAIVLLLARLGLRAGDVMGLGLSDIDWQDASLLVSGKGRREVRLPLPQEVGDAIMAYLEHGRPPVDVRQVFLRTQAPLRPFADSSVVSSIVARAIRRAGVTARFRGAHVLRHSAATQMLRQGASLDDIGAVLRHTSLESTAHYAKVDVALLRMVAQPWPEVTSC